jgi:hypothetical protein
MAILGSKIKQKSESLSCVTVRKKFGTKISPGVTAKNCFFLKKTLVKMFSKSQDKELIAQSVVKNNKENSLEQSSKTLDLSRTKKLPTRPNLTR